MRKKNREAICFLLYEGEIFRKTGNFETKRRESGPITVLGDWRRAEETPAGGKTGTSPPGLERAGRLWFFPFTELVSALVDP